MTSFNISPDDHAKVVAITRRAQTMGVGDPRFMGCLMDITACHANGCPLRLQELLDADDFNFAHDIAGIYQHINRGTGKLEFCFLPRFAMPKTQQGSKS